ncbi:MAG: hypothetical protein E7143_07160 [Rikenellaceae bacterium]|nr:hypothetical protein [Rikenellaceae bacterium]
MRYRVIVLCCVALTAVGCFKSVTKDTNLVIKTLVEEKSGAGTALATDTYAYAYYTGTDKWMVASYEDAVAKIVTDSLGVERKTLPDVESVPFNRTDDSNYYISLPLNQSPALVVLVAPSIRMYATTFKYLNVDNLYETYITLLLHPWKKAPYTEGSAQKGGVWTIVPPAPEQTESDNTATETVE